MKTIDVSMVAWPKTAERIEYMRRSLLSIRDRLRASRHSLVLRVSCETLDVSPLQFKETRDICAEYEATSHWRGKPPSLGGNQNDALLMGYGSFILLQQDDWEWQRDIDLSPLADFLESDPGIALLRCATYFCRFMDAGWVLGGEHVREIDHNSPYYYGDQPHIRRADFATRASSTGGQPVGFYRTADYLDGPANYSTPENTMAEHLAGNGWRVAALVPNACEHNGTLSTSPERQAQPVL
jgi:hypothetical protein